MDSRYLQITFRDGRPFAGYLYLDRRPGDQSVRTVRINDGLLVDYAADGRVIGIEITAPSRASPEAMNTVLRALKQHPLSETEAAPLAA
jgi:uncharacterized protein YuzE